MRPDTPVRPRFGWNIGRALLLLAALLVGCKGSDDEVIISGDVEGLDTIGYRGDSLLARADRVPTSLDSLRVSIEDRLDKQADSARPSATASPASTGNPMADRARALGDSMARASANRFATGAKSESGANGDTVRGIVTLIGSDPIKQVVLRTNNGATTVSLSGMVTRGLARLEGVDLLVRGVKVSPRDIVVSSYLVRAADGVPAFDGVLSGNAGGWYLTLTNGGARQRLATLPLGLQDQTGNRVWLAIKTGSNTVESFGVVPGR